MMIYRPGSGFSTSVAYTTEEESVIISFSNYRLSMPEDEINTA